LSLEEARQIVPIVENRELVAAKTETEVSGVYRLNFTVDDVVRDFAVRTPYGVNLIVMGTVRSAGSGCTCPANAVVRALLRHLIVERDEAVLLDMEAGVEHLGRGTARQVDTMLIVTDSSIKSLETAKHIHDLAKDAGIERAFLVGNKVADEPQERAIEKFAQDNRLGVLGFVPFDEEVVRAEMSWETPLQHRSSVAVQAIERLGEKLAQQ
jgi:CO dehydrogenase maturation factor